jgi:predicted Ser/Thr protein kinase
MSSPPRTCPRCGHAIRAAARFCPSCGSALAAEATAPLDATAPLEVTLAVSPSAPFSSSGGRAAGSMLEPGAVLGVGGRYRIERLLGRGGFGAAYLARDTELDRQCVVKQLLLDPRWGDGEREQALVSFGREARLLVALNAPGHPAIPEIYAYLADSHCVVMKYVEGVDLRVLARRGGGRLPPDDALRYARDVCAALVYMHGRAPEPVLHRDIKPANILLDSTGRVWLIDFGLAKAVPAPLVAHGGESQHGGTYGYTPPEQWRGKSEPRSDIYALGATLHTLLTGHNPASESEELAALLRGEIRPLPPARELNPALRPDVAALLARLLDPDLAARPSAPELLAALETIIRRAAAPPPPPPAAPPAAPAFVGRSAELARIAGALDAGRAVVISGMPGIGKTALLAAAASADPDALFWHVFRSDEGAEPLIWELAAALARRGNDALWSQLHSGREADDQPPPAPVLLGYLAGALRDQPLLLCLDDLDRAGDDALLAQLFAQLRAAGAAGGPRILAAAQRAPAWLADAEQVVLAGLPQPEATSLLAAHALRVDPAAAARLHAATGGSPQFLLLGGHALARAADPARALGRLAEVDDIERYLLAQVDSQLAERERAALGAVAALLEYGGGADAVEAALGENPRRALRELHGRALLEVAEGPDGRQYRLNAMLQAFYYGLLGTAERRAMHARVAEHYAASPSPLAAARHFELAGGIDRAADLLAMNAPAIINSGHAHGLLALSERLEAAPLDRARRGALDMAAGQAALLLGDHGRAERHLRRALEGLAALPSDEHTASQRAAACRWLARASEQGGDYAASLEWVGRGLAALAGRETAEAADLLQLAGLIYTRQGDYGAALERCRRSLQIAEALEVEPVLARGYNLLGHIARRSESAATAVGYFQESFARYQQLGDLHGQALLHNQIANAYDDLGFWVEATQHYDQARQLFGQLGDSYRRALADSNEGVIAVNQGRLDDALALLRAAQATLVELGASPYARGIVALNLAAAAVRQRDVGEARTQLEAARALFAQAQSADFLPELERRAAEAALCEGDLDGAAEAAQRALALAAGAPGEAARARRVLGEIAFARGRLEAARDALEASVAALDVQGERYAAARARLALARTRAHQGDAAGAGALLGQCLSVFEQLDARIDLDEARALAASLA